MATRTTAPRVQVRVSVTEGNVLYPILARLPTDAARRAALLGLAMAQVLRDARAIGTANDAPDLYPGASPATTIAGGALHQPQSAPSYLLAGVEFDYGGDDF